MPRKFEAVYAAGVRVIENTYRPEQFDLYGKEKAIWIDTNESITVTADDARKLATALVEAADAWDKDYAEYEESLKPKLPTKASAVIKFPNLVPFIKHAWHQSSWIMTGSATEISEHDMLDFYGPDFIVLFEGEGSDD